MGRKFIVWFMLLMVGFMTGFFLQYARFKQVQQELSTSTKQLEPCLLGEQLSQLRDAATIMYLETVQKNYGKAGELSKEFFDQAQRIASSANDSALRTQLHDALATRDKITGDLAKGDPAALSEIQSILFNLEHSAKHQANESKTTLLP